MTVSSGVSVGGGASRRVGQAISARLSWELARGRIAQNGATHQGSFASTMEVRGRDARSPHSVRKNRVGQADRLAPAAACRSDRFRRLPGPGGEPAHPLAHRAAYALLRLLPLRPVRGRAGGRTRGSIRRSAGVVRTRGCPASAGQRDRLGKFLACAARSSLLPYRLIRRHLGGKQ